MLSIDFLSQACVAIKCNRSGVEIISDPWFSGPAHLDSWRPFPEWTLSEKDEIRNRIDKASHIFLSHDHADHFDPEFLRTLGRKIILVGDFQNGRFKRELDSLSTIHEIIFIRHGDVREIGPGVTVQLFLQQPAFRTDSFILINTVDGCVLNANDCGLNTATLRQISRKHKVTVFLFTLNFMASGYPISYLYSGDSRFSSQMKAVRDQMVEIFALAMQSLNPELSVAFAGPVTYGDLVNEELNNNPEACDWSSMVSELSCHGPLVWPAPFSRIECESGTITNASIQKWDKFRVRPRKINESVSESEPPMDLIMGAADFFSKKLGTVLRRMEQRADLPLLIGKVATLDQIESFHPEWIIKIDVDEQRIELINSPPIDPPYLLIVSTAQILFDLLSFKVNVDDILLSARARFRRDPDTFNSILHNLLRYGVDDVSAEALIKWALRFSKCRESISVEVDGEQRRIPKFCPHEGESLEFAPVKDGSLICPRHRWRFDLSTGQCVVGDRTVNLFSLVKQE